MQMSPFFFFLLLALSVLPCSHCFAEEQHATDLQADVCRIRRHIETLADESYRGRSGPDALRSAEYVSKHFRQLGLSPAFADGSWLQEIPGPNDEEDNPTVAGWNVTARWTSPEAKHPEQFFVIAAHHDHLGHNKEKIFHGADDNASGVAMLLEVARLLKKSDTSLNRSVLFVSFDLEENLLFGSRWWTAHPPVPLESIKYAIVADMLGRSLGDLPLNSVFLFGAEHGRSVREMIRGTDFPGSLRTILLSDNFVGLRSDYGPFRARDIPFLFVSTGQSRDYHTIRDTSDKIDFQQVADITTGLARLLTQLANRNDPPKWVDNPGIERSEVETILEVCQLIDEHARKWNLTPLQHFFVSQTRARAERMLQKSEFTPDDRAWLTRTTQMLLFTVF